MIGICIRPLPQDGLTDVEESARVVLLSREFRSLKKRRANETEFADWRSSVRDRFGLMAGRLLEKVREHVYIMENVIGGDKDGQYQYHEESGNSGRRLQEVPGEQAQTDGTFGRRYDGQC